MAVHLPLGSAAILEAQLLMLASAQHPQPNERAPIAVPSQDMVLGLYYMTKIRKGTKDEPVKGEGMTCYSPEEVRIAYQEGQLDLHAEIKMRHVDIDGNVNIIETTCGRVLFNDHVPLEAGYINELLTKKSLRGIISHVLNSTNVPRTAQFLDDIKNLGFYMAFKGGLSFNLNDVIIPGEKEKLVDRATEPSGGSDGELQHGSHHEQRTLQSDH